MRLEVIYNNKQKTNKKQTDLTVPFVNNICPYNQLGSADEVVKTMVDHMTSPTNESRLSVESGDQVAVVINNLGGTSCLELGIVARSVMKYLGMDDFLQPMA